MSSPLRRFSLALKLSRSKSTPAVPDASALAEFLISAKRDYLKAIRETPSKGGEWTVVMGNEAGDLDSIASSIAFAWIQSKVHNRLAVPLMQFERDDFTLRAENVYALKLAGVQNPGEELLSLTDLAEFKPFPSQKFMLVDHNRLGSLFTTDNPAAEVIAVVDHHEDEGLYKDSADPRIIAPAGSCASHVALILPEEVPAPLATLLLCATFIDTNGLKPGGKALQVDNDAAASLVPRSTLAPSVPTGALLATSPDIKSLTQDLLTKKSDISHLSGRDLLRRDYKEYTYTLPWASGEPTIKAGLSTVPLALKFWGSQGRLEKDGVAWMKDRGLTVLGVLTSFKADKPGRSGKRKHKREMAWIVLDDSELAQPSGSSAVPVEELATRLWTGLEADEDIKVKKHKKFANLEGAGTLPAKAKARVYKQGNAAANRKVVAPLLKNILESTTPLSSSKQEPLKAKGRFWSRV